MTKRELAIISAYTKVRLGKVKDFRDYLFELTGGSIGLIEYANSMEARRSVSAAAEADFLALSADDASSARVAKPSDPGMNHNEISELFRQQLTKRGIPLEDWWGDIIYRFSAAHVSLSVIDLILYINVYIDIQQHIRREET